MNGRPTMTSTLAIPRLLGVTAVVSIVGWVTWWVLLSWDHGYNVRSDGVRVVSPGPFAAWQTVACCASIAIATVAGYLWLRRVAVADAIGYWTTARWLLAVAAPIGFAVPWGHQGAQNDETGMYVGGVIISVLFGVGVLFAVLTLIEDRSGSRSAG